MAECKGFQYCCYTDSCLPVKNTHRYKQRCPFVFKFSSNLMKAHYANTAQKYLLQSKNRLFDLKLQILSVARKRRNYRLRKSVREVACNKHILGSLFYVLLRKVGVKVYCQPVRLCPSSHEDCGTDQMFAFPVDISLSRMMPADVSQPFPHCSRL